MCVVEIQIDLPIQLERDDPCLTGHIEVELLLSAGAIKRHLVVRIDNGDGNDVLCFDHQTHHFYLRVHG